MTDNHWNEYGAYVAYKNIMESFSKEFPELLPVDISDFIIESRETKGKNLTNLLGIPDGVTEQEINLKPKFNRIAIEGKKSNYQPPSYFPYKDSYEQIYETKNVEQLKLLVIQDSFGATLIPFLSEHFNKSVYIFDAWQHAFNEDIVLKEKPDIYLQLVVESLLPNIAKSSKRP